MSKILQATNLTWSDSTATSVFENCPVIYCDTSFMLLNDFHIDCLKKSQNNTCACDALWSIVYILSPCVAINSTRKTNQVHVH